MSESTVQLDRENLGEPPTRVRRRRLAPLFLVGLAIFILSYWLPSVTGLGKNGNGSPLRGYACAALAYMDLGDTFRSSFLMGVCLFLADLANALMVLWLILFFSHSSQSLRRIIAGVALLGAIPCALAFLLNGRMVPIWGYFAWVLGMMLMTAHDWPTATADNLRSQSKPPK